MPIKKFAAVVATLTQNSTADGFVFVADTRLFRVGATAVLSGTALSNLQVFIVEIVSATQMAVRAVTAVTDLTWSRSDVSAYTLAASSQINMVAQFGNEDVAKVDVVRFSTGLSIASSALPAGAATETTLASKGTLQPKVSTGNSTTTPLLANATFTGAWEDVSQYGAVGVTCFSNVAAATNGLVMQWSTDGVNLDMSDDGHSVGAGIGQHAHSDPRAKYFRVVYTNGGTNQASFRLQTILHSSAVNVAEHRIDHMPDTDDDAIVTQSVIIGKNPTGNAGYTAVQTTPDGALRTFATNSDAFGRQTVAMPQTLFDSKMLNDNQPLYWDDAVVSGAGTSSTYNTNQASVSLAVSNVTAGFRARQTFESFGYQPGKSQFIACTGVIGTPAAGIIKNIGLFNSGDGLMFRSAPEGISVVVRSFTSGSAVETVTLQSSWNLDKMDGTGTSGINLDFTKTQIFVMMFQWLGVGSTWFGFNVAGVNIWCHRIDHSNIDNKVYMSTPNLPIRYDIQNDGTGGAATLTQICSTVISEGGQQETGMTRSIYRTALFATATGSAWYPLIAMRLQAGIKYNRAIIEIKKISILCTTNSAYMWRLVLNPTIVGTALSYTPLANSAIEYAIGQTNATTITGGIDTDSGLKQDTSESAPIDIGASNVRLGGSIADVKDVWVLAVQHLANTAEDFWATITVRET